MKFYFEEITFNGNYLVWEIESDAAEAVATETTDVDLKILMPIQNFDLEKLNFKSDITFTTKQFSIENLDVFLKKHKFKKIDLPRFIKKTPLKHSLFHHKASGIITGSDQITSTKPNPNQILNVDGLIQKSETWANTLSFTTLTRRNERELKEYKSFAITTAEQLIMIKKIEHSTQEVILMNARVIIFRQMINDFFNFVLLHEKASYDLDKLSDELVNAVKNACNNSLLINPFDHECLVAENEEQLALIKCSEALEDARVALIARDFDYKNLPALLRNGLDNLKIITGYQTVFSKLKDNIKETGKKIRLNAVNLDKYTNLMRQRQNKEAVAVEGFTSLVKIIDLFVTGFNLPSDTGSNQLFAKLPIGDCKKLLTTKIVEAIIKICNTTNEQIVKKKPIINLNMSSPESLTTYPEQIYVVNERIEELIKYLDYELQTKHLNYEKFHSAIENLDQKRLIEFIEKWSKMDRSETLSPLPK